MSRKSCCVPAEWEREIDRVLNDYRNETYACEVKSKRREIGMTPAWWVTYAILGLYATNSVWLLYLGKPWAAGYWCAAAMITVCAMQGLAK